MLGWIMAALGAGTTIYLMQRRVNIGIIMLLDAVFLAVGVKLPVMEAGEAALKGIIDETTLTTLAILVLIMIVEHTMRQKGMITYLVEAVRDLTGNTRVASVALPAVLGLLPSPGGARFSCPMVEGIMGTEGPGEERGLCELLVQACVDGRIRTVSRPHTGSVFDWDVCA